MNNNIIVDNIEYQLLKEVPKREIEDGINIYGKFCRIKEIINDDGIVKRSRMEQVFPKIINEKKYIEVMQ